MKLDSFLLSIILVIGMVATAFADYDNIITLDDPYSIEFVIASDTITPPVDREGDFITDPGNNPFDLQDPSIIEQEVEYDPETGQYIITEKIGDDFFRMPTYMTFDEYLEYRAEKEEEEYFQVLNGSNSGFKSASGKVDPISKIDVKNSLLDRLFGGTAVDIRPQGNIDLTFGVDFQNIQNPQLTVRQQKQGGFDFDMNIQMNVEGKIGEKLNLSTNYNTQATFDFENRMKLEYDSDAFSEDEILKKIEAGDVSLPLRSSLIQGSQSLFGLKTELQFGRLRVTALASQQKSKRENITLEGGSQLQFFEVRADEYDENRHFFLTHYNRDVFEESLQNLPQIRSLFKVQRIDVWISGNNIRPGEGSQIVAIADIGEPTKLTNQSPDYSTPPSPRHLDFEGKALPGRYNDIGANDLMTDIRGNPAARAEESAVSTLTAAPYALQPSRDFEKVKARRLQQTEFTFHPELGIVSLNINVQPDEVVGVAFEYDYNGKTYKVGELYNEGNNQDNDVIFVKMLKSTTQRVDLPTWNLMMKNIYSVGAYQANPQDFHLDVFYDDPGEGEKRFLPETNLAKKPLLRVFNLDQLNTQGDPQADGVFDFVPGVTINPRNGRIMFPVLEPFGESLRKQIDNPALANKYVFDTLYSSTITLAREYQEFNRFTIRGSYKSSVSNEISLGAFNLPPNSVTVRAGGRVLVEGSDYEIDYNIGRVKILNDALLAQGVPINVSFEDNTLFGFQTKTMLGLRADYEVNKNFNIGGTYLHLFERPFTQKVNIGDDPINNRIMGLDVNYSTEAPFITRFVDRLPLIETKEPSSISFTAEGAWLKPGHASAINQTGDDGGKDKGGVVYIDDFEGSTTEFDLRLQPLLWNLASVPQNDEANNNPLFPEADSINSLESNVNRAKMSWYTIDQSIRSGDDVVSNGDYSDPIDQNEVFPNKIIRPGEFSNIRTFDVYYQPDERGPYNFDLPNGGTSNSAGLNNLGKLVDPESRWGGIMRGLTTNDFQAANFKYIEAWILSPYLDNQNISDGELYFNLGNVSEDILRDSRFFFENGLPGSDDDMRPTDLTNLARVPAGELIYDAFDNDPDKRANQDVGLDGLDDAGEAELFADYLTEIQAGGINDPSPFLSDPSNDNFTSWRDEFPPNTSIIDHYEYFNNPQGNTPAPQGNFATPGKNSPDSEDINDDQTMNESETYFQYKVPLEKDGRGLKFNQFVVDSLQHESGRVWYRVKIPLDQHTAQVGNIQDFRSIRFMRMYMTGFDRPVVMRFAKLGLVRNQWFEYTRSNALSGPIVITDPSDDTVFDVNAVNIEENSSQKPFGYILPQGIARERSIGAFPDVLQNEQSLSMEVCNLKKDDARGIFKIFNLDMRNFERLKMFVHSEEFKGDMMEDGDMSVFIRMGSDFEKNYYEYEIPLTFSRDPDINPNSDEEAYQFEVWKDEFNFALELFTELKKARNAQDFPFNVRYEGSDPESDVNRAYVIGNPNLGYVKGIMIGLRNNDEAAHNARVWVNEMRVNGINETGGMAGLARLDIQLADFGTINGSVSGNTFNWGGLEQKVADRKRERNSQLDASTSLSLGKLLPEKSGIKIPFYAQYSEQTTTPEFDPYDLDLKLQEKLDNETDLVKRDSMKEQALDKTVIKGWSVTNVRKERTNREKTPMPWDIENFSFTYAHTQTERSNPIIASDKLDDYHGGVDYNYTRKATYVTPFKKLIKKDKWFKLLTDFNFNPLPNTFQFNSGMDRQFRETVYRFAGDDEFITTYYNKRFTWDRSYNVKWDLTKSLKFNFDALNTSVIDEPEEFFTDELSPEYGTRITKEQRNDQIKENIRNLGRTKVYDHHFNVSYTVPFKKIPILDWVQVKASYDAGYGWNAAALNVDSLGNIIQNNHTRQVTGDLNFENLYNKSKYLKKINKPGKGGGKDARRGGRSRGDSGGSKDGKSDDRSPRGRGDSKDKGVADASFDKDDAKSRDAKDAKDAKSGKTGGGDKGGSDSGKDSKDGKGASGKSSKDKKKDKEKKDRDPSKVERLLLRPLMTVRKARLSYNESYGSTVPGYKPSSSYFGQSDGFGSPGWPYALGWQPDDAWYDQASDKANNFQDSWITDNVWQNQQALRTFSQTIDAKVTLEPFADFRIELDANRRKDLNSSEFFKDTLSNNIPDIVRANLRESGSFTVSYFALNTLFRTDIVDLFKEFEDNRPIISERLDALDGIIGVEHQDSLSAGYKEGLGRTQPDVLIPAFLAAYTGKDANTFGLDIFKTMPKINWKLTYNGLTKIPWFKERIQSASLTHGYRSTLTVNSFQTDSDYQSDNTFILNPVTYDYYSRYEIPRIVISEQFAPMIGIDLRLKNEMTLRVDFKKSRNLALRFDEQNQLDESKTTEYTAGFGYVIKDVKWAWLKGKKRSKKKRKKKGDDKKKTGGDIGSIINLGDEDEGEDEGTDLNFKFDFSFRDDITIIHKLDQNIAEPTRGSKTIRISPSIDYDVNKRLNVRLFFDRSRSIPATSASFPITNTAAGVTIRFQLN